MSSLTREQILDVDDIQIRKVETPEWDGEVYVRTITATEHYEHSASNLDDEGKPIVHNFIVKYCSYVMCDSEGNRTFTDDDVEALGKKSSIVLMRIYKEAKLLNGEDIDELEKNLEETQSEDFTSD